MHLNLWFIMYLILYFGTYTIYLITRTAVHGWSDDWSENCVAFFFGLFLWFILLPYILCSTVIREFAKNPIKEIVLTSDEQGYWLISRTGRVIPFGNAYQHDLKKVTRGHVPEAGERMLSFTCHGRVFGPAGFISHGDLSETTLVAPIVTAILSKSGKGYWLVGADGTVHAFGEVGFFGDTSKFPRNYGISWRADMQELATEGAKESKPFLIQDEAMTTSTPTPLTGRSTASAS